MKTKQMIKTWALMAVLSPLALACLSPDVLAQETHKQNLLGPVYSFEDFALETTAPDLNLNPDSIQIDGVVEENKEEDEAIEVVENDVEENKEEDEAIEVVENDVEENKEEDEAIEVVENEVEENKEEDEAIEVVENEVEENKEEDEAIEVVENDVEEIEEENNQQVISLIEKNKGLETTVCEQSNQIASLEEEINSLRQSATGYMPLMDTMNQLMMMNMMMAQQRNQISYATDPIGQMSSMLAPMMMMQSMQMGMNIASMNDLYHRSAAPAAPQYHYNVAGDFYGRDYSVESPQAPTAQTFPTYFEPQAYDFGARNANFDNIEEAPATGGTQRAPGQTESAQEPAQALAADQEMVD